MKLLKHTIPSEFIKLDTRVSGAYSFADVYGMNVARQNHNWMVAHKMQRDILNHSYINGANAGIRTGSLLPVGEFNDNLFFSEPILIGQQTKSIDINLYASKTFSTGGSSQADEPKAYFALRNPFAPGRVDLESAPSITLTNAFGSPAWYNVELNVPRESDRNANLLVGGHIQYYLEIYVEAYLDSTFSFNTGSTVSDAGNNWIETTASVTPGITSHIAMVCETSSDVGTRLIAARRSLSGGVNRYYADGAFGAEVDPGTDTFEFRQIMGMFVESISAYENEITSFSDDGET